MDTSVNQRSAAVEAMALEWPILEALNGGTPAMRAANKLYLPQWPNEHDDSYACRIDVATLFPAYQRTVSVMSGKPFSKQLTLSTETPAQIVNWSEDIDKEGVNLHAFCAEMFEEAFYGFAGILVEAPKPISGSGRAVTVADQKAAGVRPYFVRVKHNQIIGYRWKLENGARVLTQLRISESTSVEDGEYGEKCVERVRVLRPGEWEVLEKQTTAKKKEAWVQVEKGRSGLPFIPFVPIYGIRRGFMVGTPPLRDLAYMNVKHWQSQSDQDTILHVARVPILFAKMLGENALVVGANSAVKADDSTADIKYVEHSGKAIEAGEKSLTKLEEQMIQAGAEFITANPGVRTATEDNNDAEGNKCDLQRMAENFEDSLDQALWMMAQYASLDKGGKVSLFKDYAASNLTDASAQLVLAMNSQRLLTRKTTITEMQRRNVLSPDIKPEDELSAVDEEGPAPGTLTDDDDDDEPDDE
jgi:hypothetical protein